MGSAFAQAARQTEDKKTSVQILKFRLWADIAAGANMSRARGLERLPTVQSAKPTTAKTNSSNPEIEAYMGGLIVSPAAI